LLKIVYRFFNGNPSNKGAFAANNRRHKNPLIWSGSTYPDRKCQKNPKRLTAKKHQYLPMACLALSLLEKNIHSTA